MAKGLGTVSTKQSVGTRWVSVGIVALVMSAFVPSNASGDNRSAAREGEELFTRQWEPGKPATDGAGDGLGPMFNDVSCVACHGEGGVGGSGGIEKNAVMLNLSARPFDVSLESFSEQAARLHPSFVTPNDGRFGRVFNRTLVLHKFSTDQQYNLILKPFRQVEMLSQVEDRDRPTAERKLASQPKRKFQSEPNSPIHAILSQRNSPALFGLGLIDRVSERDLREIQRNQRKKGLVSGKIARVFEPDRTNQFASRIQRGIPVPGKFGWKAQTGSLAEFVRNACANELGLQIPDVEQARNPLDPSYRSADLDLNERQLTALVGFVSSLEKPIEITHTDRLRAESAQLGKKVFTKVGCAECHVENLGEGQTMVVGVYSDLLLHDMGSKLADPMPSGSGGGYYGIPSSPGSITSTATADVIEQSSESLREWRTPPLWGVSASAPYLHDGRASTLTEAIIYHAGEAKFSVRNYLRQPPEKRIAMIDFLNTLIPPDQDDI